MWYLCLCRGSGNKSTCVSLLFNFWAKGFLRDLHSWNGFPTVGLEGAGKIVQLPKMSKPPKITDVWKHQLSCTRPFHLNNPSLCRWQQQKTSGHIPPFFTKNIFEAIMVSRKCASSCISKFPQIYPIHRFLCLKNTWESSCSREYIQIPCQVCLQIEWGP